MWSFLDNWNRDEAWMSFKVNIVLLFCKINKKKSTHNSVSLRCRSIFLNNLFRRSGMRLFSWKLLNFSALNFYYSFFIDELPLKWKLKIFLLYSFYFFVSSSVQYHVILFQSVYAAYDNNFTISRCGGFTHFQIDNLAF